MSNYDFLSETFRILNKCSWWVQNASHPSPSRNLLHELDRIATRIENSSGYNGVLLEKANGFCPEESDWHGKSQQELNKKEREKER
jgi:hypothetical protein